MGYSNIGKLVGVHSNETFKHGKLVSVHNSETFKHWQTGQCAQYWGSQTLTGLCVQ